MNDTPTSQSCHVIVADEPHMSLAKAMRELGICRKTAYRWRDKGKLPHHKHEGRIYCPTDQVLRIKAAEEAARRDNR